MATVRPQQNDSYFTGISNPPTNPDHPIIYPRISELPVEHVQSDDGVLNDVKYQIWQIGKEFRSFMGLWQDDETDFYSIESLGEVATETAPFPGNYGRRYDPYALLVTVRDHTGIYQTYGLSIFYEYLLDGPTRNSGGPEVWGIMANVCTNAAHDGLDEFIPDYRRAVTNMAQRVGTVAGGTGITLKNTHTDQFKTPPVITKTYGSPYRLHTNTEE